MVDTNTMEIQTIEMPTTTLQQLLTSKDDSSHFGPLWQAWNYLQMYSIWGLHLPSKEAELKTILRLDDPAAYRFYEPMLNSYQQINTASRHFTDVVFQKVVEVCFNIKAFGKEAATSQDNVFSEIIDLLKDRSGVEDAKDLVVSLQKMAKDYAKEARETNELLKQYGKTLSDAKNSLVKTDRIIAEENKAAGVDISTLTGDKNKPGSLAYLQKALDDQEYWYEFWKIRAITTVAYGWVPFVGVILLGIFTDNAVKAAKALEDRRAEFDKADLKLKMAFAKYEIQSTARKGVSSAKKYTEFAITQIGIVETAWQQVSDSMGLILKKLNRMTTTIDDQERLRVRSQVKSLARKCGENWDKLWPAIVALTTNPYIKEKASEMSLGDAITAMEEVLANSKK